jgi:hypothetical protein
VVDRSAGFSPRAVRDGGTRQTCAPRAADTAARSPRLTHAGGIARSQWSWTTRNPHTDCVGNPHSLASLLVRQVFRSCNDHACCRTFRHGFPGLAARVSAPLTQHDDRSPSTRLTQESARARQQVVPPPARMEPGSHGVQPRIPASHRAGTFRIRGRIVAGVCLVGRVPFLPAAVVGTPPASSRVPRVHSLTSGWISPQS